MLAAFLGKLNFDGSGENIDCAVRLANTMVLPAGARTEEGVCGALAVAAAVPPGTEHYDQPLVMCGENCLLVGSGSLYNRQELIGLLDCPESVTDLELIWRSWRKWGDSAPARLDGDWMFAGYDGKAEKLILARSWGLSSLFYYQGGSFLAFATHPAAIAALPGVTPNPNIRTVTQILCGVPIIPRDTAWQGIYQVEPASQMVVGRGKKSDAYTWWRPSTIGSGAFVNEKEALNIFIEMYTGAVQKRLYTSREVGATLSSGLDSSSICILAAGSLAGYGKVLNAWTSVPQYPDEAYAGGNWLVDESDLAAAGIRGIKNIRHRSVEASDVSPVEAVRKQLLRTGRPHRSGANQYWIDCILSLAFESGCGILLTGQFGNGTVSWSPSPIRLLPKKKHFPNTPWGVYLNLVRNRLKRSLKNIIKKGIYYSQPGYPAINPDYARSRQFAVSMEESWQPRRDHAGWAEVHMNLFDAWYHYGFWSGVEVRDPTMDVQLAGYLLSLPDAFYFRDGLDRRIMRLGMSNLMPDEVRLNRRRGQQGSDIVPRIRQYASHARRALAIMEKSSIARDIVDIQRLNRLTRQITKGETGLQIMRECGRDLLPGLSAGLFLASFDTDYKWDMPLV